MDSQYQGEMSYTDLFDQDLQFGHTYGGQNETSPVNLEDSQPLSTNNPTSVRKSIRGVNFTIEEDKLLVSAWLNCTLDAIHGTDQKHAQYWEKIFEYFKQHKVTTTDRTIKSLIQRWSFIQKATNKFCAKVAQVEGLNQSGMTEHDKLEKAKMMYSSLEKSNFQFEHCWYLLKDQPKWLLHTTKDDIKKRKTILSPSRNDSVFNLEAENVTVNEVIEFDRPMGRKAEKQKRRMQGKQVEENLQLKKMKYTLLEESRAQEKEFYRLKAEKMEYDKEKEEKKLLQEDERLKLEIEKMELAKKESDQRVMMMDVSVMPEMQRLYFQGLQRKIMMERGHV
ncbi:hypothetical protein SSX86_027426 [Deinandra increscens subsp. villosa]|uniref:No apical meristem-associated C-terminal domain-containing protein n=1 Tax=Deinandra increscens subsp. villosa TaxID=3103831 RepID=A0AAP0CGQ5_9ASTR